VPLQPDVLYNPWFDLFILVEDSDGEINSVGLASSLAAGQAPQLQVQEKFWQELYRRYPVAQMATFAHPKTFENTSRVILEMRNLTNRFGWPSRVQLTHARVSFELISRGLPRRFIPAPLSRARMWCSTTITTGCTPTSWCSRLITSGRLKSLSRKPQKGGRDPLHRS